jgi:hypothetical protein
MKLKDVCKFLLKSFRMLFGFLATFAVCAALYYGNSPMAIAWGLILYFHLRLIHLEKDREIIIKKFNEFLDKA